MSKPWGKIGAWAEDAERGEEEDREVEVEVERERQQALASTSHLTGKAEAQSFPSLKEAAAAKPKKKKTMPLSEFTYGTSVAPGGARRDSSSADCYKGLTPDEMLRLPTGPRERSSEEMEHGRLGGGFRSYGRASMAMPPARMRERGEDVNGSWSGGGGGGRRSYGGGFDDDRRVSLSSRVSDYDQPSRADEVDNWAMAKKPLPVMDSGRQDRYGSLGSGSSGGVSRADEIDNWSAAKQTLPARSTTSFGSGFKDSAGSMSDRWGRGGGVRNNEDRERPRIVLDPPRGDGGSNEPARTNRSNPFGAARPREDVLAEKGLDWRKLENDIETRKMSRSTGSQSSRPSSAHSSRPQSPAQPVIEGAAKVKPKVNPFGDAKPREILLEEQGKDWRKIDLELEHRGVDRPETDEEKMLKEEISHLKKELEKEAPSTNGESVEESAGKQINLHELLLHREKDLELLIRELDDKVRFGQKAIDRPGSGSGRVVSFPERPPSQSGVLQESRNVEFRDRPPSRGTEMWSRSGDDRRSFQGDKERAFLGYRNTDRSRSRERW